jgi:glycosyltransferase involved in cell wall biosynthesis
VLLIAGRAGAATAAVEARIAALPAEVRDRVRLLGHRDDVPELLAAADVFAFPSHYEGLGGSLLEAMALALPIVASDLPAISEVVEVGATGVLTPPRDPAALAAAIDGLLADPAGAAAMGARGRDRFLERFTAERTAGAMVDLYERVAGGR